MINKNKEYCYRIIHIENLPIILETGIVCKKNSKANSNYINIGNPEIIDVRSETKVRIEHYGMIGDYVPFYFTSKSIMLFNIQTGYRHPVVPKRGPSEILVMRFRISDLISLDKKWFFTDGQANDAATTHYNSLSKIDKIDWQSIHQNNFSKSEDFDRARRYQAELLVKDEVPIHIIESINVYDDEAKKYVEKILKENKLEIKVNTNKIYYF
ncbi:type II toxin-antitoxin system toxin DNA ADP-ribosyl transferase DarT [Chryseobacterium daeguense]|uniref:type II toxin-antitoxin system toxin DNA ADP-ribosyl transferase DarT n=1 Tax=Chryseobacterium daeguense TaxID=412438 RepID=UPI00040F1B2F|nr:DUF4433 domain-containing protein [Chryseobacterium daeguense]